MDAKILGTQELNFTNSSGESVRGTNIFVAFSDENVQGVRTEKFFLRPDIKLPEGIKLNDTISISFNHKGRIEKITK